MKVFVRKDGRVVIDCDPPCADRLVNLLALVAGKQTVSDRDAADAQGILMQIKAARMLGYQPKEAHK